MFEIRTYWKGDLLEVTHAAEAPEGRQKDGPLTVVVERTRVAPPRPIALPPDFTFARTLCLTAIVELVLITAFLLTPKNDLLYVLGDELGTMKKLPGPDWIDLTYAARFVGVVGAPEGGGRPGPRGPLLSSPPGSRTYRAPEGSTPLLALIGSTSGDASVWSALVSEGRFDGGVEGGVLGVLADTSVDTGHRFEGVGLRGVVGGLGGLGLRGTGLGGGGTGEGIVGLGSVGVAGGGRGYGRLARRTPQKKKEPDDKTRVVYCKDIVDYVRDLMPDDGAERPSRLTLYYACRRTVGTTAAEGMACVGKAKDQRDGRIELLLRCGDELPETFVDALKKEGMRE